MHKQLEAVPLVMPVEKEILLWAFVLHSFIAQ